MSALMVSRFNVGDADKLAEYMSETRQIAGGFDAELVFSGSVKCCLNGMEPLHQIVVVRFPDTRTINEWFDSAAYRRLTVLRERAADMTMVSYG